MSSISPLQILRLLHLFFAGFTWAASAEEWRTRRIYQLLTDRFARSVITSECDISARKYCMGSWKGMVDHLDYIKNMGFDAVWISPVVANVDNSSAYGEAYHGYWTKDITQLNPNFGTADDLRQLSKEIHNRGMYLMVDVVVNHFAVIPSTSGSLDFSSSVPFNSADSFHTRCSIQSTDYTQNQTAVEQCWLGDDKLPLPDLNTENSQIVQTMNDWIKNLTTTYSIDGLRIDTVKHVRKDFWPAFAKAAGVYTLGEVLDNRVDYASDYTKVIDGILDYPTYFAITSAFSSIQGNLSAVVDTVTRAQQSYDNGLFFSGSFLENHDQPRFQNLTKDLSLVKNAVTWPFIQDGLPILYYGQEQGFDGGSDPFNREALWTTGYPLGQPLGPDKPIVTLVTSLNQARKLAGSTSSTFHTTAAKFIPQGSPAIIAVSKPPLLALLTNIGANSSTSAPTWTIPGSAKVFKGKETLVDVLSCGKYKTDKGGGLSIYAAGGLPKVLLPLSALSSKDAGGLCSTVTNAGERTMPFGMLSTGFLALGVVFILKYLP